MADNLDELRNKAEQEAVEAENKAAELEKQYSSILHDLISSGQFAIKEGQDLSKTVKTLDDALKARIKHEKLIQKVIDEATKSQRQLAEAQRNKANELKKPQNFLERIGFREPTKDDLATQYRASRMSAGVEAIMEGRFSSGLTSILSTVPKIANFMGGPYFLAIQAVTSGLLKLDDAIAKTHQEVLSGTGGVYSPFRDKKFDSIIFQKQLKSDLKQYGLQDKIGEVLGSAFSSTGLGAITDEKGNIISTRLRERVKSQGAAMRYMGSLGISEDAINNMFKISRNLEGQNESQALATQYRLAERFKRSRYMTESEGAQQSISLYEQTKSLGVNFEWASRTVAKFDKALQLGEISLNDFAAVTKSIRGADTGKAAGIAQLVKDIALENNIELPQEFVQSNAIGSALYLQTRQALSNPNIQKALKLTGQRISGDMSAVTSYDEAGNLRLALQALSMGNLAPEMALNIQQSGNWNPILGGRSGTDIVNNKTLPEQSEEILNDAKDFYKNQRSMAKIVSESIGTAADKITTGLSAILKNDQSLNERIISIVQSASLMNPISIGTSLGVSYVRGGIEINSTQQPGSEN